MDEINCTVVKINSGNAKMERGVIQYAFGENSLCVHFIDRYDLISSHCNKELVHDIRLMREKQC